MALQQCGTACSQCMHEGARQRFPVSLAFSQGGRHSIFANQDCLCPVASDLRYRYHPTYNVDWTTMFDLDNMPSTLETLSRRLDQDPAVYAAIGFALILLSWRVWRFHVIPAIHPNDPKELPYWIPCKLMISPN